MTENTTGQAASEQVEKVTTERSGKTLAVFVGLAIVIVLAFGLFIGLGDLTSAEPSEEAAEEQTDVE